MSLSDPFIFKNVLQEQFIHKTEHNGRSLRLLLCAASRDTAIERCVVFLLSFIISVHSFFLPHHIQFRHKLATGLTQFLLLWCCSFGSSTSKHSQRNVLAETNEDLQEVLMKPNVMEIICFQYFFYSQSECI